MFRRFAVLGVTVVLAGCASDPGVQSFMKGLHNRPDPVGWTVPLAQLGIDGSVDRLAERHPWQIKQVSSYDPTGGDADDQFGQERFDGGVVLADIMGPGAITRIWTRNPWGMFYLFVDDMEHPVMTVPFRDLFGGDLEVSTPSTSLFSAPFVGQGGGGYYCYVPIPFAQRCRMVVTGDEDALAYQVTYAEFAKSAPIQSFNIELTGDDERYFRDWRDSWNARDFRYHDKKTEKLHRSSTKLWPQSDTLLAFAEGPGTITEIEMDIASQDASIIRNAWIAVYFDGQTEPGILAPVGDFFGTTSPETGDYSGAVLGNIDGRMWCRYPMPFKKIAEFRILNTTDQLADFGYSITWKPGETHDADYFYARYATGQSEAGKPLRVAQFTGKGTFAGASIAANTPGNLNFLEGDPTYRIDDSSASTIHGTGLDDFFNLGWHFATGPFSAPTHGCTLKSTAKASSIAGFRSHITDAVPFESSFAFDVEHGSRNDQPGVSYSSVLYWYQAGADAAVWELEDTQGWIRARNTDQSATGSATAASR